MDLRGAKWRKSSRSGNVGACVEVAVVPRRGAGTGAGGVGTGAGGVGAGAVEGCAAVRDSKNPDGGVILVPLVAIRTLLHQL